ncbi:MAG: hypothetical protein WKF37_24440 [Bryobacteraceae bacterium]
MGTGKDPAVVVTSRGRYAAWTGEGGVQVRTPGRIEPTVLDKEGAYVQLAAAPNGKVFAVWERQGAIVAESLPD